MIRTNILFSPKILFSIGCNKLLWSKNHRTAFAETEKTLKACVIAYPIVKRQMFSKRLGNFMYLIDLKPLGIENVIASYVLHGNKVAIVETGPTTSIPNLLAGLQEVGIKNEEVDYVAVSHIHIDHAGGAGTLLQNLSNAKLIVHPRGAPHLIEPQKLWTQTLQVLGKIAELYGEIQPVSKERIVTAYDGMIIDLGDSIELKVLETLGHASHHLSFFENRNQAVFPGDAAGIYVSAHNMIVPTTPPPFNLQVTLDSINRLIVLNPKQLYYTHFGPAGNAVKKLEEYANRLKFWAKIISDSIKNGDDFDTICQKILEKDSSMKSAADYIRSNLIFREGVIKQDVQGFIEYLKKGP
jgi:glyoxylase-like metal-dependent hydrolase (beta-lactamase superfamily II)